MPLGGKLPGGIFLFSKQEHKIHFIILFGNVLDNEKDISYTMYIRYISSDFREMEVKMWKRSWEIFAG